jgi:hypothetical protein
MSFRLADIESRRWLWRPALVATAGVIAIGLAIALNLWQAGEVEHSVSSTAPVGGIATSVPPGEAASPSIPLPSFDIVRINPNGDTVIAGRAAPGAVVVLRDGESELGTVIADGRGEWVLLPETPLQPGAHRLNLLTRDSEQKELASAQEVLVVVPKPGEDVAGRPADATAQPLVLRIPRDGGPATVLQKPLSGGAEAPLGIDSVDWQNGRIVLEGHAPPQSRIRLALDGKAVGEAVADAGGRWRILPKGGVGMERHALTLEQIDARGAVTARVEVPLSLQELSALAAEPAKGGDRLLVVQRGTNLWRIARTSYGHGAAYTIIFQANREQIVDPHRIYPGQVFRVPGPSTGQSKE